MKFLTEVQVRELEKHHQVTLPQAYVGFLRGDYGDFTTKQGQFEKLWDFDALLSFRKEAEEILAADDHPFALGPNDFVYSAEPGHEFRYFPCEPGVDDPPVSHFIAGNPGTVVDWKHFSDYVGMLREVVEMDLEDGQADAAPSQAELDLIDLIQPPLREGFGFAEEKYRQLPVAMQQGLGKLLGSFQTSGANLLAGFIFGVILAVFGAVILGYGIYMAASVHFQMPFYVQKEISWATFLGMTVLSAGLVVGGVVLLARMKRLAGARLLLCEQGLCWAWPSKPELILWSAIQEVQVVQLKEGLPLDTGLKHVLPKSKSQQLAVFTSDGKEHTFTSSMIRELPTLQAVLERVATVLQRTRSVVQTEI